MMNVEIGPFIVEIGHRIQIREGVKEYDKGEYDKRDKAKSFVPLLQSLL